MCTRHFVQGLFCAVVICIFSFKSSSSKENRALFLSNIENGFWWLSCTRRRHSCWVRSSKGRNGRASGDLLRQFVFLLCTPNSAKITAAWSAKCIYALLFSPTGTTCMSEECKRCGKQDDGFTTRPYRRSFQYKSCNIERDMLRMIRVRTLAAQTN